MIAAIVRGGRSASFKGALDYVLRHNLERVGETGTANLFSTPDDAHREMQTTVDAAKAIQARARMERGERSAASGSRAEKTCFHYALSWHPDDEITPDRMFKAAHQTLDRLGLSQHQAVIVEHTERPHKHVHVIVSTVHPETGRANSLYRNAYTLDRWCHEYERSAMLFRSFKRAARYEPQPEKKPDAKPDWKAWKDRQKELWQAHEATVKAKQEARREEHEGRVNEVRRNAEIDKSHLRNRHRREIAEFWRKQAPKMTVQPRPSQSFLHSMSTEGGEMGKALKAITRPRYHPAPPQQAPARAPVHSTFKRALSSTTPLQPPSPEQVRSGVNSQFRERAEPNKGNVIRHAGIADRFQGEQAIKRWQRGEIEDVERRTRAAIEQMREEREEERDQDQRDREELKDKHNGLRDEARRELGIPDQKVREQEQLRQPDDARRSQNVPQDTPAKKPTRPEMDVRSYVDDYVAGRGRDSREHEQFAANHGAKIEEEFQRRAAEADRNIDTDHYGNEIIDMTGPVEPEPLHEEPPPLEPDTYIPADREPPPPEHDMDFEMGD